MMKHMINRAVVKIQSLVSRAGVSKKILVGTLASLVVSAGLWAPVAHAAPTTMVILDGSGSMWVKIGERFKIDIAREAMRELTAALPDDSKVGLMSYGHRRKGDCSDIQVLVQPGVIDKNGINNRVKNLQPLGMTPLTDAVEQAARLLKSQNAEDPNIILVTDGLETCNRDLCDLYPQLQKEGFNFKAHVVAFDLSSEDAGKIKCIADQTGGLFIEARDAKQLRDALQQIAKLAFKEDGLPIQMARAIDAINTLVAIVEDREGTIRQLRGELEGVQEDLENEKITAAEAKERAEVLTAELRDEIAKLSEENEVLQKEAAIALAESEQERIDRLQAQDEAFNDEIEKLKAAHANALDDLNQVLADAIKEADETEDGLRQEIATLLQNQAEELKQLRDDQAREIELRDIQINDLRDEVAALLSKQEDIIQAAADEEALLRGLIAEREEEIDNLLAKSEEDLNRLREQAANDLAAQRVILIEEADKRIAELNKAHKEAVEILEKALDDQRTDHEAIVAALEEEIAQVEREKAQVMEKAASDLEALRILLNDEADKRIAELNDAHKEAIKILENSLADQRADHAAIVAALEKEIEKVEREKTDALEKAELDFNDRIEELKRNNAKTIAAMEKDHSDQIEALQNQIQKLAAEHEQKLAELDQNYQEQIAALTQQMADQAKEAGKALQREKDQHQRNLADLKKQHAGSLEALEKAMEDQRQLYDNTIAELTKANDQSLEAMKDAIDQIRADAQAARDAADAQHANEIGDLKDLIEQQRDNFDKQIAALARDKDRQIRDLKDVHASSLDALRDELDEARDVYENQLNRADLDRKNSENALAQRIADMVEKNNDLLEVTNREQAVLNGRVSDLGEALDRQEEENKRILAANADLVDSLRDQIDELRETKDEKIDRLSNELAALQEAERQRLAALAAERRTGPDQVAILLNENAEEQPLPAVRWRYETITAQGLRIDQTGSGEDLILPDLAGDYTVTIDYRGFQKKANITVLPKKTREQTISLDLAKVDVNGMSNFANRNLDGTIDLSLTNANDPSGRASVFSMAASGETIYLPLGTYTYDAWFSNASKSGELEVASTEQVFDLGFDVNLARFSILREDTLETLGDATEWTISALESSGDDLQLTGNGSAGSFWLVPGTYQLRVDFDGAQEIERFVIGTDEIAKVQNLFSASSVSISLRGVPQSMINQAPFEWQIAELGANGRLIDAGEGTVDQRNLTAGSYRATGWLGDIEHTFQFDAVVGQKSELIFEFDAGLVELVPVDATTSAAYVGGITWLITDEETGFERQIKSVVVKDRNQIIALPPGTYSVLAIASINGSLGSANVTVEFSKSIERIVPLR